MNNNIVEQIQLRWNNNDDIITFIGKEYFDKYFIYCCIDMVDDNVNYETPYNGRIGLIYNKSKYPLLIEEGSYICKDSECNLIFQKTSAFI